MIIESIIVLQALFFGSSSQYTTLPNVDDITTQTSSAPPGWEKCVEPSCNPGGNTAGPTSFTQTFANSSPSRDGGSMSLAMVAPAQTGGTNGLYTYKVAGNPPTDSLTHLSMDLWVYCDTNCGLYVKQLEFDEAIFCVSCVYTNTPNGTNYMFGSQCNITSGLFQIFNQAANSWVNATYSGGNIPCSGSGFALPNTWHHLQESAHKVAGDANSCTYSSSTYPTLYYDNITLDGTSYTPTNTSLCAGNLPSGYSSTFLIQQQIDVGASGTSGVAATVYYDDMEFLYW